MPTAYLQDKADASVDGNALTAPQAERATLVKARVDRLDPGVMRVSHRQVKLPHLHNMCVRVYMCV